MVNQLSNTMVIGIITKIYFEIKFFVKLFCYLSLAQ